MKNIDKDANKLKVEFIEQIKSQLDYDGLMNLSQWFKDNAHKDYHHWGYVRSIAYRMERLGLATVLPEDGWQTKDDPKFWIKHAKWADRHPYLHNLYITLIGSVFSLLVALTVLLVRERHQRQLDDTQNTRLQNLHDSVTNIHNETKSLKDTLTKYIHQ